ncbi:hypothetical protein [Erwinia amylovora]|uniref:hypothetical protein n=1 Tax=Erwinia amylovora TaxID=552 RepID=UPI0020BDECA4|nr:hypothetical protein [Erwinia amylovora]MCK8410894.1 hypothetical protein [Erwinia amylovora]
MIRSTSFLCAVVFLTPLAYAGIPLMNFEEPLKVSESSSYRCGSDGEGLVKQDTGEYRPLKDVTCHDDHLWQGDKALTFIDMLNYSLNEAYKQMLKDNPKMTNSAN